MKLPITEKTSIDEITNRIVKLREQKGKEKETLKLIEEAFAYGHGYMVNLFWEEALTYQHLLMAEEVKGEKNNKKEYRKYLQKMQETVMQAKYYIVYFDLEMWKHRLYRFMGRVADYQGEYDKAIKNYRKSLKHVKQDPDYITDKYPRWLEIEAFISHSLIMSGKVKKGYKMAMELFNRFDEDPDARRLNAIDYATWAIWRSGIAIRTIEALLASRQKFDKDEAKILLTEAENILKPPKGIKVWTDFGYRLTEIKNLKRKLRSN